MGSLDQIMSNPLGETHRVLIFDSQDVTHELLRHTFHAKPASSFGSTGSAGTAHHLPPPRLVGTCWQIDSAFHVEEALRLVDESLQSGHPYSLLCIDAGASAEWNGVTALRRIWELDAEVQTLLYCSAANHSWNDILGSLIDADRLALLRNPWDDCEARRIANCLIANWHLRRREQLLTATLHGSIAEGRAKNSGDHVDLLALNRKLEMAKAAAEEANQAKSSFLATMSHEIRTPMTAILGYADYLLEEGDLRQAPRERIQAINTIVRNGNHLVQLINDILDLSKIEANRLETERIPCQPLTVAMEVVSMIRARAEERALTLAVHVDGSIPETIQSDPTRIRQILVNLLGNAIKFTDQGRVDLALRMVTDAPEGFLQFEVRDTGMGMSAAQIKGLFKPFTQADSSMTRKYGGTGLGLCICKRLAEMLGGNISVVSELNLGSTFRVNVNTGPIDNVRLLNAEDVQAQRDLDPVAEAGARQVHLRMSGRVLLAEDGPDNQRLLTHLLSKAGAEVTVVENGQLALEAVLASSSNGNPFDLVLMDMQMPVLDGYAASRKLREQGCKLPVIALTAFAMTGDRERCLEHGCTDYLTKPIVKSQFLSLVKHYLESSNLSVNSVLEGSGIVCS